jgi:hypothetical protein
MSSRSLLSSPIQCSSRWQHGQVVVVEVDDDLNPRRMRGQRSSV